MYIISENEASRDTAVPFLSMGKLESGLGKEVNICGVHTFLSAIVEPLLWEASIYTIPGGRIWLIWLTDNLRLVETKEASLKLKIIQAE